MATPAPAPASPAPLPFRSPQFPMVEPAGPSGHTRSRTRSVQAVMMPNVVEVLPTVVENTADEQQSSPLSAPPESPKKPEAAPSSKPESFSQYIDYSQTY